MKGRPKPGPRRQLAKYRASIRFRTNRMPASPRGKKPKPEPEIPITIDDFRTKRP